MGRASILSGIKQKIIAWNFTYLKMSFGMKVGVLFKNLRNNVSKKYLDTSKNNQIQIWCCFFAAIYVGYASSNVQFEMY